MSRAQIIIGSKEAYERAFHWLTIAKPGTRIEFKKPQRSIPQNDRMWLILTEIARREWHGHKYRPDEWKDYFMHSYRGEKWMPAEDGGMVPIGRSTSDLGVEEHSELQTLMEAFCARQGIRLPWDEEAAA